jgi:hypothetical protein
MHYICANYAQNWRICACVSKDLVLVFLCMAAGTPKIRHGTTVAVTNAGAYKNLIRPV